MTPFESAQQELRLLESQWISLLSWLSEKSAVSPDELVKAWSADDYYKANTRLAADSKKAAGATWTILDFIDFGSHVHLASRHSDKLAPLGVPPKDWVAQINKQMAREGLVTFRNHLQHANRFAPEFDLELHAFGTRQLSRILFLWFLQQKRWLGNSAGDGNINFLTDLFRDHGGKGDMFFADVLTPIFFDGLGRRTSDPKHRTAEGFAGALPYLGGGIFTLGANEFEAQVYALNEEGEPTRRVILSDDLFDPRKDDADGTTAKGKSRKRSVLGLLRGYRFTTQESTPDDQSIDPDPELLGKVFENLYQADERHATGAYYTPREIVQFMCRRTLDGYLREQTDVVQDTLDWLREEAVDWRASDRKLSPTDSDALVRALERVRVLDPAVGSGAFLLTMMHEIVTLRRGIEQSDLAKDVEKTSIDVADWKRRVATDSLYGVDINPMAVEICHLRLWLSIIVDLEVSNYRQIPALPNLDFRIVAGDSLIDRMGEDRFFESLLAETKQLDLLVHNQVKDAQKQLDGLKDKFSLAEGAADKDQKRLRDLRQKIREKQVEIAHVQLAAALDKAEADLNLLQGPKPKAATKKKIAEVTAHAKNLRSLQSGLRADGAYQKPFLWPVNFHDVFEAGGFDPQHPARDTWRAAATLSLSRPRHHGDDRSPHGGGARSRAPVQRLRCVGLMVGGAPAGDHRSAQPRAGVAQLDMELRSL